MGDARAAAPVRVGVPAQQQQQQQGGRGDEHEHEHEQDEAIKDILYSANSFTAVMWPVTLTMVLSALAVVYINDGRDYSTVQGGLPLVYREEAGESDETKISNAIINALAIIGTVAGMTFLMVALYYFKCTKILIAWLIFSTAMLLGFTSGLVVQNAFEVYNVPCDAITYYFVFYNFAITGVVAIFYQWGIPQRVTQGYLIIVSVTMAWLLVRFLPAWTSWALLVLLAVYDLCAVLTPCGPLKWLVEMAQERDDPLPGLLYEAQVGGANGGEASGRSRPARQPAAGTGGPGHDELSDDNRQQHAASFRELQPNSLATDSSANEADDADSTSELTTGSRAPAQQHVAVNVRGPAHSPGAQPGLGHSPHTVAEYAEAWEEEWEHYYEDRSVKLGLGDFVFLLCTRVAGGRVLVHDLCERPGHGAHRPCPHAHAPRDI